MKIGGALCLRSCMNQQLAIVAKLLQPADHVRGLIIDDRVRDSSFRAEIGGPISAIKLLGAVGLRAKGGRFEDRFASEAFLTSEERARPETPRATRVNAF